MNEQRTTEGDEYIRLSQIPQLIRRNLGIMALVFVAILGSAFAYALLAEPVFKVSAKFLTTGHRGMNKEMSLLSQLANVNVGSPAMSDPSQYFPDLLQDDGFLAYLLHGRFPMGGDSTDLEAYWGLKPDSAAAGADWRYVHEKRLLDRLKRRIAIASESNGLMVLTTKFDDPAVALEINKMILARLDDYLKTKMKSNLGDSRKFIETQMQEAADRLAKSERDLTEFNMRNLHVTSPASLGDQRRLMREATINQELYLELKKQFFLARIEDVKNLPAMEIISEPTLPIARNSPRRTLIVLGGALMGLLFALPAAFLKEWITA